MPRRRPPTKHAGEQAVLTPLAIPQKEALRGNAHLYESLEALERWVKKAEEAVSEQITEIISSGGVPEVIIIADTSASDQLVVLPDPSTLPDPKSIVNVKNWNGGVFNLHINGGGYPIDGGTVGIDTHTNNQGYRFRFLTEEEFGVHAGVPGWACIETVFGGDTFQAVVPTCADGFDASGATQTWTFLADGNWPKPS